jgi:hypothetical protein
MRKGKAMSNKTMRIYFAGKIAEEARATSNPHEWEPVTNWRFDIFGHDAFEGSDSGGSPKCDGEIEMGGGVIYCGPHFQGQHGQIINVHGEDIATRAAIFARNNACIDRADHVFAYIDATDAYGTFFEIGYAVAKGIPATVVLSAECERAKSDLWYILQGTLQLAGGWEWGESRALLAFEDFCRAQGLAWREDTPLPRGNLIAIPAKARS